jgi:hypothetical protein
MKGNEHAFPHLEIMDGIIRVTGGLSRRELFAALAMQGRMATKEGESEGFADTAEISVEMADALIAALESK